MKNSKNKLISILIDVIILCISAIIIQYVWHIYKLNDFGDLQKAEYETGKTEFIRDSKNRYSDMYSYKISSGDFNDALIYKEIEVEKDSRYKVTAMVKYENVMNEQDSENGGVNICLMDTTEKSISYTGSGDWTKLTFEFNSKNRETVKLAFRLGSYDENSKGTVWFSDFKIEKSVNKEDNNWNCVLFIMKNLNINIANDSGTDANTKLSLEKNDIKLLKTNMERFQNSMLELSRKPDKYYI
jgi:hypothetical protein